MNAPKVIGPQRAIVEDESSRRGPSPLRLTDVLVMLVDSAYAFAMSAPVECCYSSPIASTVLGVFDAIPATWVSAAAAIGSFAVAFFLWRLHTQSFYESFRPDLILSDWSPEEEGEGGQRHSLIKFNLVKNIGRGAAFSIVINLRERWHGQGPTTMSTIDIPVVPNNQEERARGDLRIWWQEPEQFVSVGIDLLYLTAQTYGTTKLRTCLRSRP